MKKRRDQQARYHGTTGYPTSTSTSDAIVGAPVQGGPPPSYSSREAANGPTSVPQPPPPPPTYYPSHPYNM
jgi:hypothetical protein